MVNALSLQEMVPFKEVPINQLNWFIENSDILSLKEGEFLFKPGDPLDHTWVILKGAIPISVSRNNQMEEITTMEAGDVSGYLPFSRGVEAKAYAIARVDSEILSFSRTHVQTMMREQFELTQALVHVMTTRVRDFTTIQQQNDKMMALGKLSAGLTHELNNPAAAIVRSSASLKEHLHLIPDAFKQVIAIKMTDAQVEEINAFLFSKLGKSGAVRLSMMQKSALEDDFADFLDNKGVHNADEISENLVEFGYSLQEVETISAAIPPEVFNPVITWINSNLVTERTVDEIHEASQRIFELVKSVKVFSHMDRSRDKTDYNVIDGIRNTLVMLNYKIRKGNVTVKENFDLSMTKIKAHVGEMNQVWTNLIDNAIDAMEANLTGTLEIKTSTSGENLVVNIIDNGSGIPDDIKLNIFDPFFTTKDVGKGTGLGLESVHSIIKMHKGSIKFNSVPGRTDFEVCLPIQS